jgi:hypothetical protein
MLRAEAKPKAETAESKDQRSAIRSQPSVRQTASAQADLVCVIRCLPAMAGDRATNRAVSVIERGSEDHERNRNEQRIYPAIKRVYTLVLNFSGPIVSCF